MKLVSASRRIVGLYGLLATCHPVYVSATWSVIGTDRATGQIGGAGATCREESQPSNPFTDDYQYIIAGKESRCFVGQASAEYQDSAKTTWEQNPNWQPKDFVEWEADSVEQWAAVDLHGRAYADTGSSASAHVDDDTRGHVGGDYTYSVQGNRLSSDKVIENAQNEFKKKPKKREGECDDLADRLMRALEAGAKDGGGDWRCTDDEDNKDWGVAATEAYIKVYDGDGNKIIDEKVLFDDNNKDALARLRTKYENNRGDCEKRPKKKDRIMDPLPKKGRKELLAMSIVTFLGLLSLVMVKKRKVATLNDPSEAGYELQTA